MAHHDAHRPGAGVLMAASGGTLPSRLRPLADAGKFQCRRGRSHARGDRAWGARSLRVERPSGRRQVRAENFPRRDALEVPISCSAGPPSARLGSAAAADPFFRPGPEAQGQWRHGPWRPLARRCGLGAGPAARGRRAPIGRSAASTWAPLLPLRAGRAQGPASSGAGDPLAGPANDLRTGLPEALLGAPARCRAAGAMGLRARRGSYRFGAAIPRRFGSKPAPAHLPAIRPGSVPQREHAHPPLARRILRR